jgi:homoserine O-acetyltransferase
VTRAYDPAGAVSDETRRFTAHTPLPLESGEQLGELTLAYRTWGTLNAARDNAVLVCHALTGSADADAWWPGLIGSGCALDPAHDFIVCSNVIGGCYGSSGPLSLRPGSQKRFGGDFPRVTIRDMVHAQKRLIDSLGVESLALALGPSLGGMQVLEWAASYPDSVRAIAPIGVSGRHSAWCIAVGEAQRQAIYADPGWQGGLYDDAGPEAGLAAARMMAMVTYRSWQNFESRFGREPHQRDDFSVGSYLQYQGRKLVNRFDAVSYVRLTEAMDSHDLGRGRSGDMAQELRALRHPALIVSVSSDVLYPPAEQAELAAHLPNAHYETLESAHGHDGFLIDMEPLSDMIRRFRAAQCEAAQAAAACR